MLITDVVLKEVHEIFNEESVNKLMSVLAEGEETWSQPMTLEEILAHNDKIKQVAIEEGRL